MNTKTNIKIWKNSKYNYRY